MLNDYLANKRVKMFFLGTLKGFRDRADIKKMNMIKKTYRQAILDYLECPSTSALKTLKRIEEQVVQSYLKVAKDSAANTFMKMKSGMNEIYRNRYNVARKKANSKKNIVKYNNNLSLGKGNNVGDNKFFYRQQNNIQNNSEGRISKSNKDKLFFCTKCGKNRTHSSENCYFLTGNKRKSKKSEFEGSNRREE
ncbi:hypothetical protein ABK040_016387 [Willaertia magna]